MRKFLYRLRLIGRGISALHRLAPYNLLAKCIRSVCNALLPFVNLYMSSEIIDRLVAGSSLKTLMTVILVALTLNLALVLISKQMDAVNYRKWNQFYLKYRFSIGEKIQHLPFADIENEETHIKIKRIDDAMKIGNYGLIKLHSRIPLFVENMIKVILSIGLIVTVMIQKSNAPLTGLCWFANSLYSDGVLIVLVLCAAIACIVANRRIASYSYEQLGKLSKENRVFDYYMDQYLDGHKAGKDIRLYRQNKLIEDEMHHVSLKNASLVNDMDIMNFKNQVWIVLSHIALLFFTYLYVGAKSIVGVFEVGGIVKYSGGVLQFASAFSDMMDALSQLMANTPYLETYFDYVELPEEKDDAASACSIENKACCFEVDHVSFCYPGTDRMVLNDISFTINTGETVAIVGENGCGKTTMIKLLCGLYEPTQGIIRFNGIDIREYDKQAYQRMLGVVFQDFKLLSFSIAQNVAASTKYDSQKVASSLKQVGFNADSQKLHKGTDAYLYKDFDENGVEISGGEAQKIALARVLYKDAPVVILDEPTAALDPIAEAEIYESFDTMIKDKTTIFISHRLSSCQFSDKILVFSKGRLIQEGKHTDLLRDPHNQYYAELWNAQAKYYRNT